MRAAAFATLLIIASSAAHAQQNSQPQEVFAGQAIDGIVCDPGGSTRNMSACYVLWREHEEALLEQATSRILAYAQAQEAESRLLSGPHGYVASITAAQANWLQWRDSECSIVTLDAVGGSIRQLSYASCQASLTAQRHQRLDAVLEYWRAEFRDPGGEGNGVGCILEPSAFRHCPR